MTMSDTIILKVGAEGGGITLYGRRNANQKWEFRRVANDSWVLPDVVLNLYPPTPVPVWVKTWKEAVTLLDRNPWTKLVPLSVHSEFREEVLVEVTRRLLAEPSKRNKRQMDRWLKVCGAM